MTGKGEVRKENEQVQKEIEDDRRHVIQVSNLEKFFCELIIFGNEVRLDYIFSKTSFS